MNPPVLRRSTATTTQAHGSYCDLHELIALRALASRLRMQPARSRHAAPGAHTGTRRGRGIEFEELRAYEAGDDVRTIDWRTTARSGRVHTRVFREERERPVFLLVDQRRDMFFGSRHTLKSVQATHAAALLAWATLEAGDRIGGVVIGEHGQREIRPRRSHHAVLELLQACTEFNHRLGIPATADGSATLVPGLAALRRLGHTGSLAVIISDFSAWDESSERELQLLSRRAECHAIQVFDPLERALPDAGIVQVSDAEHRLTIDTRDKELQQRHATHFERSAAEVARAFARFGSSCSRLPTDEPAATVLVRGFPGTA